MSAAPDSELEAIFIPKKRTSFFPFVIGVTVVVALVGIGLRAFVMPEPVERIDPEVASEVRDVLPMIESKVPSERGPWIAMALVELLQDRVPGSVRVGLRQIAQVGPEQRRLIWMSILAKKSVKPLWRSICYRGGDALAEVMREGRKDGGMFMYQRCKLHKLDLINVNHVLESGAPEILLAHAIYNHLQEEGTLTDLDTRALRLLARSNSHPTGTRPAMAAPGVRDLPSRNAIPERALPPPPELDEAELLDRALE